MQSPGDGSHKFWMGCRLRRDQVKRCLRLFGFEQKLHGVCLICSIDPRHGLFAIAKPPAKEESRRKGHAWKQATVSGKYHRISDDHTPDTQFFDWFCRILPESGELIEKVIPWRSGFICKALPSQA